MERVVARDGVTAPGENAGVEAATALGNLSEAAFESAGMDGNSKGEGRSDILRPAKEKCHQNQPAFQAAPRTMQYKRTLALNASPPRGRQRPRG